MKSLKQIAGREAFHDTSVRQSSRQSNQSARRRAGATEEHVLDRDDHLKAIPFYTLDGLMIEPEYCRIAII